MDVDTSNVEAVNAFGAADRGIVEIEYVGSCPAPGRAISSGRRHVHIQDIDYGIGESGPGGGRSDVRRFKGIRQRIGDRYRKNSIDLFGWRREGLQKLIRDKERKNVH